MHKILRRLLPMIGLLMFACREQRPEVASGHTFGEAQLREEVWQYDLQPKGDVLMVHASFPKGVGPQVRVAEGGGAAIKNLMVDGSPHELRGDTIELPECKRVGCSMSYTFAYKDFAMREQNLDGALWSTSFAIAQPRVYLLHPAYGPYSQRAKICGDGIVISAAKEDGCYLFPAIEMIERVPYSTLGRVSRRWLGISGTVTANGDGPIQLIAPEGSTLLSRAEKWMARSIAAVSRLYGGFPMTPTMVSLVERPGNQVYFGFTRAATGGSIVMHVGSETDANTFAKDWMLTHEMVHLGFPSLPVSHRWMEEGFATYGEVLARRESGEISVEETWGELARSLPKGAPENERDSLERAVMWSRIYWGGAAAWFSLDAALTKIGKPGFSHLTKRLRALGHHDGTLWSISDLAAFVDAETEAGTFERYVLAHHSQAISGVETLLSDLGVAVSNRDGKVKLSREKRELRARIVRE